MAILTQTAAGGATQFDGTTGLGLFIPAANTGGPSIQARLNSVSFSTSGAITNWTLNLVDPSDGQVIELLTDTTADLVLGGPAGFMILPTNSDGVPWRITFLTTGMISAGTVKIDVEFVGTES
jgi:hypothetical protein